MVAIHSVYISAIFWLRGTESWSWISNASLTLRSNLRSSVLSILESSHLNPDLQVSAWRGIPEASHFSSITVFWCWQMRDCTLSFVSPTYFFPQMHSTYDRLMSVKMLFSLGKQNLPTQEFGTDWTRTDGRHGGSVLTTP